MTTTRVDLTPDEVRMVLEGLVSEWKRLAYTAKDAEADPYSVLAGRIADASQAQARLDAQKAAQDLTPVQRAMATDEPRFHEAAYFTCEARLPRSDGSVARCSKRAKWLRPEANIYDRKPIRLCGIHRNMADVPRGVVYEG